MTAAEHRDAANRLLDLSKAHRMRDSLLAEAQVHATLALVEAHLTAPAPSPRARRAATTAAE